MTIDPKGLLAGQIAAMESNGCGYTHMGLRHFCDHPYLPDDIRGTDCACKTDAAAAITAYLTASQPLPQPEQGEVGLVSRLAEGLPVKRDYKTELQVDDDMRGAAARISTLESQLKAAREALEPFAMDGWTDEIGWTDRGCPNDRICDWFGPSAFRAARSTLNTQEVGGDKPS